MIIKAYFDKDLLYTNRKIVDLTSRDFEITKVISFNGGNRIDATMVYNTTEKGVPTYIVIDNEENGAISTFNGCAFYVTAQRFIRKNQWQLQLLRDLISETTEWKTLKAYIRTGYPVDNSFVKYNRHKFNLNTIKTKQDIVSDNLSLAMFFTQRQDDKGAPVDMTFTADTSNKSKVYAQYEDLSEFPFNEWVNGHIIGMTNANIDIVWGAWGYSIDRYTSAGQPVYTIDKATYYINSNNETAGGDYVARHYEGYNPSFQWNENSYNILQQASAKVYRSAFNRLNVANIINANNGALNNAILRYSQPIETDWEEFQNKIIRVGTKFYKCVFTTTKSIKTATTGVSVSAINNAILTEFRRVNGNLSSSGNPRTPKGEPVVSYTESICKLELQETTLDTVQSVTIPFDYVSMDSVPVKALVIPNLTRQNFQGWVTWAVRVMQYNKEVIQAQLLPFNITGDNAFGESVDGVVIGSQSDTTNYPIKMLIRRDWSFFMKYDYKQENEFIEKEGKFVRICSPSYATIFDITPYLNDGLSGFQFNMSVKPFGTTIYCQPAFGGLYSQTFEDKRGLVIQEDFSISSIDDKWIDYKYMNQNYINSFNRQIESLELNNYYARESDRLALERSDNEAMALARETTGSKWGMFDKLLLGIPSLVGGYASNVREQYNEAVKLDTTANEILRQDNIALQKEIFNNNLGNIKSISPTLNKVDTFDIMNKYSIIVEYYECSEIEKQYIMDYYEHNGAVIGMIGTFEQYWGLVVSGQIIQSNSYTQEELKELNNRLKGGIYTGVTVNQIIGGEN